MSIAANNPALTSWVQVPENSDFPIQNLPFGVIRTSEGARVASRIGDFAVDLKAMFVLGYLENLPFELSDFAADTLNNMLSKGKQGTRQLRNRLSKLFDANQSDLARQEHHISQILVPVDEVEMLLPVQIGDYTDFYSSERHAYNVGCMFRDPANALMPNWKYIPVGYHGRSSSIVVSGTPFHRPKGQQRPKDTEPPVFGPCKLLDFELEMGFITYGGKPLGDSITTAEADDYIFGMCLFNDWSARDIQKWEYVPLGPFLAKNFASHLSPWVVTLDALEPFRVAGPVQDPKVFPYLEYSGEKHLDISLEVSIALPSGEEKVVTNSNYRYMYWNMNQQLAHHTINGCNIKAGDMMASGTISGDEEGMFGSMLEITWQGTKPISMPDGSERKFIADNDTVIIRGYSEKDGVRVGFGEVSAPVLPAK
ncbi:MAG: fumarylacetoacetase [Bacteroidetes bacterium RIFCSPHIGHO2_02_FULL_44_7]|nr:MAG: fumarylacetoacetase [Bacteroidetes bacterium RIFCSPHIGHO2_02_FULL_44_7]